jgi:hypothetical protein
MLLIRCHGRCIDGKYRRGRQGLKNESLYRTTEPASGHPPFSSLRPRAHVRVFAGRRAAMDSKTTRGLRIGCDATLQSVHPGRSACLNLHVRLPALSQPGLPRLLRRPQKEGETPLRNPIIGIDSCCARYERRRNGRAAAKQRDELAAFHSITSSAMSNRSREISRFSALAVFRFITSSNLIGCSTGILPGFVPRKILSTMSAVRRNRSGKLAP